MKQSFVGLALRAFALGLVCGSRSATGGATSAFIAGKHADALADTPLKFVTTPAFRRLASVGAVGEFVVDKLSITPSRILPGPISGRIGAGAIGGGGLFFVHKRPIIVGALLGAVGGFAGSHLGYNYRVKAAEALKVPDFPLAVAEDVAAVAAGTLLVKIS